MSEEYPDDMLNGFTDLRELLPQHQGFFRPALLGAYGLAIFIKKELDLEEEGEKFVHVSGSELISDGHHSRNLQWIKFNFGNKLFTVINVHGLWNGKGKDDTKERINQSRVIKDFLNSTNTPKILCGDFNLNPDTESIKILEENMKNLVKDYSIPSTRTSFYTKPLKFADYVFISPDVKVKDFKVLPDEVSDHSALFLEFTNF